MFNATRTTFKGTGFAVGADTEWSDWILGAALRYGDNEAEARGRFSKADVDSYTLGLYGARRFENLRVRFGATYGRHQIETQRQLPWMGDQRLKADYDADSYQIFAEVGRLYDLNKLTLEPYFGLSWNAVRDDAFVETEGFAALNARAKTYDNFLGKLGARGIFQTRKAVWLEWDMNWQHVFGNKNPQAQFALAGSNGFLIDGAPLNPDAFGASVGAAIPLGQAPSLRVGYDGIFGNHVRSHGGHLTLNYQF